MSGFDAYFCRCGHTLTLYPQQVCDCCLADDPYLAAMTKPHLLSAEDEAKIAKLLADADEQGDGSTP